MGKCPAFQFYPSDWTRDLEEHPLEIEGAWIRICCRLWWSETPGEISKSLTQWSKSLAIHHNTCLKIFAYLAKHNIATIDITCQLPTPLPASYLPCYLPFTGGGKDEVRGKLLRVVNRRMVRDHEIRVLRSKSGTLGGNPNFEKGKTNPYYKKDNITKTDKQKITPSTSSSSSTSYIYSPTSDEVRLSELLLSKIQTRNPGFKNPNIQKWAIHIDRLMRIDKKTNVEIQKVIEWCQEDSFWQNNILSTDKLRAKYDALNTKRLSGGSNGNRSYQGRGNSSGYGRRDRGADELPPEAAAELAARIKRINDKV